MDKEEKKAIEAEESLHRFHIANSFAWIVLVFTMTAMFLLYFISHKQYGFQLIWHYAPTWIPIVIVSVVMIILTERNMNKLESNGI